MTLVKISGKLVTGTSTAWYDITGTPTTLEGYGITDAAPISLQTLVATNSTAWASGGGVDLSLIATTSAAAIASANSYTDGVAAGKANVSHTHSTADITGLDTKISNLSGAIDGKQASGSYALQSHSHSINDITNAASVSLVAGASAAAITSANSYTFITASSKANLTTVAGASAASITSANSYTDGIAAGKADVGHTHSTADVTGLDTKINNLSSAIDSKQASGSYASATHTHDVTEVTNAASVTLVAGASAAAVTSSNSYASGLFTNLVGNAPSAIDTIYELASAINNDPAFSVTILSKIAALSSAIDGIPTLGNYASAVHTHSTADITGLDTKLSNLSSAIDGKQANGSYAAASHTHDVSEVTNAASVSLVAGASAAAVTSANSYTFVTASGKADTTLVASVSSNVITSANSYTDGVAGGKANTSHTHSSSDITGLDTRIGALSTAIDGKQASGSYASATHTHDVSEITNAASVSLVAGASAAAITSANSYTDTVVASKADVTTVATASSNAVTVANAYTTTVASGKANSSHTHTTADVTGLDTRLTSLSTAIDGKQASGSYASATHTHDVSSITNAASISFVASTSAAALQSNQTYAHTNFVPISGGTITGNLNVLGSLTYLDTNVAVTSAMYIDTNSTDTALRVTQRGSGDVIRVEDETNPDATPFIVKSDGLVGIGTAVPIQKLTVVGNVSATGSYYGDGTNLTGVLPSNGGIIVNPQLNGYRTTIRYITSDFNNSISTSDAKLLVDTSFINVSAVNTFVGASGTSGTVDGFGLSARFFSPEGMVFDSLNNLYVCDTDNHAIRKISPNGFTSIFAGSAGVSGTADGLGTAARFRSPIGIVIDTSNNLFVCDSGNHTIRKILTDGTTSTFAGTAGVTGVLNGTGTAARFNNPTGLAIDTSNNLFVCDTGNHTIRKITAAGVVTTFAGLTGTSGVLNGTGTAARFNAPFGVVCDSFNNLFVCDTGNHTLRRVTSAAVVTTFAGLTGGAGGADGTGTAARFSSPRGIAVASTLNTLYVADAGNSTLRRVTSAAVVTTFVGSSGSTGYVDGIGSVARLGTPYGIALDAFDNVYFSDIVYHSIRKTNNNTITLLMPSASNCTGSVFTVKLVDASPKRLIIYPLQGNVDGSVSTTLTAQYQSRDVISHNSQYWIL